MIDCFVRPSTMLLAMLVAALAAGNHSATRAQDGTVRKIAPEAFPEYRQAGEGHESPVVAILPTPEHVTGSCRPDMRRPAWIRCLQDTAALTSRSLDDTMSRVKDGIEARQGVGTAQKRYWSRVLGEVHEKWLSLRDQQCSQLAASRPAAKPDVLEARLLCLMRENARRQQDLADAYQLR